MKNKACEIAFSLQREQRIEARRNEVKSHEMYQASKKAKIQLPG
jgi:hypothetical protein